MEPRKAGNPLDLPADAVPQRWVDTLVARTQGAWPAKDEPETPRRRVTAAGIR